MKTFLVWENSCQKEQGSGGRVETAFSHTQQAESAFLHVHVSDVF